MRYIKLYENFVNSKNEVNKIVPELFEILKKYDANNYKIRISYKLINENTDQEKFVSVITCILKIESDSQIMDETIKEQFDNIINDNVENINTIFQAGTLKNKTLINTYQCIIRLYNDILADPKVIENEKDKLKKIRYNTLDKKGLIDFFETYDITNFNTFVEICGICARDVNKYAKITNDNNIKKLSYQIKDWVIKMLFICGYIVDIKMHDINDTEYFLLITKIKCKDAFQGVISFHIPKFRINKFGNYLNVYGGYEKSLYVYSPSDTPIENKTRMEDFIEIANSQFASKDYLYIIKKYFDNI